MRLARLLACGLLLLGSALRAEIGDEAAATAVEISGQAVYEDAEGSLKAVELGQLFVEGDRLVTKEESSLQLVLADGSSLALGPNSELSISKMGKGGPESHSLFELARGAVNAMVEKLGVNSAFEVHTAYAVAAVKGTQFEVTADESESAVTVQEGTVEMADPDWLKTVSVNRFERALASKGRLNQAFALPKREAGDFEKRWERSRMIHAQQAELMKSFAQHLHERKAALLARQEGIKKRREERAKEREKKGGGKAKKEMLERRKAARERFERARQEIQQERKQGSAP